MHIQEFNLVDFEGVNIREVIDEDKHNYKQLYVNAECVIGKNKNVKDIQLKYSDIATHAIVLHISTDKTDSLCVLYFKKNVNKIQLDYKQEITKIYDADCDIHDDSLYFSKSKISNSQKTNNHEKVLDLFNTLVDILVNKGFAVDAHEFKYKIYDIKRRDFGKIEFVKIGVQSPVHLRDLLPYHYMYFDIVKLNMVISELRIHHYRDFDALLDILVQYSEYSTNNVLNYLGSRLRGVCKELRLI